MKPRVGPRRLGIVGCNGWLGNAVAAVASRFGDPARLTLSGRSDNRGAVDIPGARWTKDNAELADRSDVIVLSVRPDQFPAVGSTRGASSSSRSWPRARAGDRGADMG